MEVITTHTNADFDTLASMVAAKKLYPDAHLVFPGSLEKALAGALETLELPCRIERIKEIDLDAVTRLILVDIKRASRIGPFAKLLDRDGVDVHVYDHHARRSGDVRGSIDVYEPYGSTTTILTHIIRERGIGLSADEATILMAGIYEDTGSLIFPSTTAKDYEAASFLLDAGADLVRVAELLKKDLTPDEVSALSELLKSETTFTVGGIDVIIATARAEDYHGDLSQLAHRLCDMEGMACLFLLAETKDRIHVIARSRTPDVNAAEVVGVLGGGGHPQAASASLKDVTLVQAKEKVLAALKQKLVKRRSARDIMTSPAITVALDTTIDDAQALMQRYNINAAPVVEETIPKGVITRQVIDRARHHGFGRLAATEFMTTDFEHAATSTSIEEIRESVIGHGQRLLPVLGDEGGVEGVITRTDVMKLLREELVERPEAKSRKKRSVKALLRERLPAWALLLLKEVGETAESLGSRAYVVGGFVRDLLLRRDNLDIDIVIEGDGIAFAKQYAGVKGLKVRCHKRFKTAVIILPNGFKIDVATARLEYYDEPGALPTIELSSLKLDLYRRDFTVNTLAADLGPDRFGLLIDFFDGQKDIREKSIRVLHNLSFVEDPTRALRGVRFSERFGFDIAQHTLRLLKNSVKLGLLGRVSGARIRDELKNIISEERASDALARLEDLGLLKLIHPSLKWDDNTKRVFESARDVLAWHRLLYTDERPEAWLTLLLALSDTLSYKGFKEFCEKISIASRKGRAVIRSREEAKKILGVVAVTGDRRLTGSRVYELLNPLPLEITLYLMAKAGGGAAEKTISEYITKLRPMRTALGGDDLKGLGIAEGPEVGKTLAELFRKRLDNELKTRADEIEYVKARLKHGAGG